MKMGAWTSGGPGFLCGGESGAALGPEEALGREKPRFGMCSSGVLAAPALPRAGFLDLG